MLKRFLVLFYLFSVVFRVLSATPTQSNSGSGTLGKPSVKFKEWQIGRSFKNSDSRNDNPKSFITSTGTTCHFFASVVYDGNQGDSVSPIDPSTVSWTVPVAAPKAMELDKLSVKTNWSGSKHPSKLDPDTSFNVIGTISVPAYTPTAKPDICKDENNHRRDERTPLHRGNKKLGFTLKFTAETEDGQEVETKLVLEADNIDQLRQEYVDLNRPIPERGEVKSEDTYDFGHYEKMLNEGLSDWYQKWIDSMNNRERADKAALTKSDFTLNSGYRNPHHNQHHAGSGGLSPHMYGYALDVAGKDLNDDNTLDRQEMVDAAYAILQPHRARWSQKYSDTTHVHADWALDEPVKWTARRKTAKAASPFPLPPAGTDTASFVEAPNNPVPNAPNAPPAPPSSSTPPSSSSSSLQACGHRYDPNSSSAHSHRSVNFPCDNHFYYACAPATTSEIARHSSGPLPCGAHTGYPCDLVLRHLRTRPCPPDAHGNSCSIGSYYGCSPHSHSYPAMKTCDAGHSYRADHPNVDYLDTLHRTRTCRREACGRSWQPCVSGWAAANCPASSTGLPCWGTDD